MSRSLDTVPFEHYVKPSGTVMIACLNASIYSLDSFVVSLSVSVSVLLSWASDDVSPSFLVSTLIDSGSTHSYISPTFVSKCKLTPMSIQPIWLQLFDGSSNNWITQSLCLEVTFPSGLVHSIDFLVTPLDHSVQAVLGYSWLSKYNPTIDWQTHGITFQGCQLTPLSDPPRPFPFPDSSGPHPSISTLQGVRDTPTISMVSADAFARAA